MFGIEYNQNETCTYDVTDTLLVNKPPSGGPGLGTGYWTLEEQITFTSKYFHRQFSH